MVEVTPQELEKIQAGKLNAKDIDTDNIIDMLIEKAIIDKRKVNTVWDAEKYRNVSTITTTYKLDTAKYGEVYLEVCMDEDAMWTPYEEIKR